MADDYRQTDVVGSSYTRARSLYFENPKDGVPSLLVREEEVINLGESKQITQPTGEIRKHVSDLSVEFPLRDPTTNEIIPGQTATYQDLYVLLFGLYWHLAEERDNYIPPEPPIDR